MDKRASLAKINNLQGDLIFLKNHTKGKMEVSAALFLEFINDDKTAALISNLYIKWVAKIKISHVAHGLC